MAAPCHALPGTILGLMPRPPHTHTPITHTTFAPAGQDVVDAARHVGVHAPAAGGQHLHQSGEAGRTFALGARLHPVQGRGGGQDGGVSAAGQESFCKRELQTEWTAKVPPPLPLPPARRLPLNSWQAACVPQIP